MKVFQANHNLFRLSIPWITAGVLALTACNAGRQDNENSLKDTTPDYHATEKPLTRVRFLPYWVSTAQFAGYYVAAEKGIYEKYGIDIEIIPFQPFLTNTATLFENGEVDFAAIWLENAIGLKASGADIVNIAQPSTQSSLMLITKKSSGIATLEQMNGKKAGIWEGFDLQPRALFSKYGLDVKIIPIGSTNNLFLKGGVDITVANWFDEYHSILNTGFNPDELNTFFFKDYGFNFLEDGIYCPAELRESNPQLCEAFIKATFEGWLYAFSHPDHALDIVIQRAREDKIPVNRVHQQWMLDRYRDLYFPRGSTNINTRLSKEDYLAVGNLLLEGGLIKELPTFETFYQPVVRQ
ncbi:MAG: ABC transporter substrate-binding protein [Bacteroidales bacterium]